MQIFLSLLVSLTVIFCTWLLSEFGRYRQEKLENKKALGRVLAVLINIRQKFSIKVEYSALSEELEKIGVPQKLLPYYERLIKKVAPVLIAKSNQISERLIQQYDEAAKQLSGLSPVLGAVLQTRDLIDQLLTNYARFLEISIEHTEYQEKVKEAVFGDARKSLDEVILAMAKSHARKTLRDVKDLFKKTDVKTSPGLAEAYKSIITPEMTDQMLKEMEAKTPNDFEIEFEKFETELMEKLATNPPS